MIIYGCFHLQMPHLNALLKHICFQYTATRWAKWYPGFIKKWRTHAIFWLQKYEKSLHIIIYKDITSDVRNQLSDLMNFFGYTFDGPSLHRHCCVLDHPFNKDIKRKPAVIDQYKEMLLEEDEVLKSMTSQYVSEVQQILDDRWPGIYNIKRG